MALQELRLFPNKAPSEIPLFAALTFLLYKKEIDIAMINRSESSKRNK